MHELSGLTLVVTRPAHQADVLCQLITEAGGRAIRFPVIEILPPTEPAKFESQLGQLSHFDIAIFISANAVHWTFDTIEKCAAWPEKLAIAAVGKATAKALKSRNAEATIVAPEPYNSEALLALPELQDVHEKSIVIFRGEGGRGFLGDTLQQRGARLEYAECYRRGRPQSNPAEIYAAWDEAKPMAFIITSNEGLENLCDMLREREDDLLNSSLLVVSERTVALARQKGFGKTPILASSASDEAMISAAKEWAKLVEL